MLYNYTKNKLIKSLMYVNKYLEDNIKLIIDKHEESFMKDFKL